MVHISAGNTVKSNKLAVSSQPLKFHTTCILMRQAECECVMSKWKNEIGGDTYGRA